MIGRLHAFPAAGAGAALLVVRAVEAVAAHVIRALAALDVPVRPDQAEHHVAALIPFRWI